jgi:hypothetical protein
MDGRTAFFTRNGKAYGTEAYHPNHRVIWRDTRGQCTLCFQYNSVSCWKVFRTEEGEHYAVSDTDFRVEFDEITEGAFDCTGAPLS